MQLIISDIPQAHTETEATSPRRWWTLAAVCTGVFMLLLDLTIVNVALPDIERAFQASLSDLQWVVSAYALTLAAFLLTAGSLADLYGRRLLFATGIVLFTAGSLCCGLATGSLFLTLARGGQGVGGAIMFATSLALLAQAFQDRERAVALGLFGALGTGFVLIGAGLLMMRGLTPASGWTHLLAGMVIAGAGTGLVSTPLVSTAVGVVAPARAGMASGINSTLRQVGVATGVAALGTTLAARVHSLVLDDLRGTVLSGQMHTIAHQVSIGAAAQAVTSVPPASHRVVAVAARSALVQGLNTILLIAAIVAFISAGWCALVRERDFVTAPPVAAGH